MPETDRDLWLRGRLIWENRSCGDCADGPPCRCFPGQFTDRLTPEQQAAFQVYQRNAFIPD